MDVYSYGFLVCEVSTCEQLDGEESGKYNQITRIQNKDVRNLVQRCTVKNPRRRPTMQQIIESWRKI